MKKLKNFTNFFESLQPIVLRNFSPIDIEVDQTYVFVQSHYEFLNDGVEYELVTYDDEDVDFPKDGTIVNVVDRISPYNAINRNNLDLKVTTTDPYTKKIKKFKVNSLDLYKLRIPEFVSIEYASGYPNQNRFEAIEVFTNKKKLTNSDLLLNENLKMLLDIDNNLSKEILNRNFEFPNESDKHKYISHILLADCRKTKKCIFNNRDISIFCDSLELDKDINQYNL